MISSGHSVHFPTALLAQSESRFCVLYRRESRQKNTHIRTLSGTMANKMRIIPKPVMKFLACLPENLQNS